MSHDPVKDPTSERRRLLRDLVAVKALIDGREVVLDPMQVRFIWTDTPEPLTAEQFTERMLEVFDWVSDTWAELERLRTQKQEAS
jgi:hypothetical protein